MEMLNKELNLKTERRNEDEERKCPRPPNYFDMDYAFISGNRISKTQLVREWLAQCPRLLPFNTSKR